MISQIKVGCCGFPKGKREYFRRLKLVEIQQTFYHPPSIGTAKKWREDAPEDFEFSLKAWQLITHPPSSPTYRKAGLQVPSGKEGNYGSFKPSEEVFEAWTKTWAISQVLEAKVVVFQCPGRFTSDAENVENMRYFFTNIDKGNLVFAWEPRGEWRDEIIAALCQDLDLIHCVDPLETPAAPGKTRYFRLHGGQSYRHQYTDDELARLCGLCSGETYVLFNNITSYDDALRFKQLIESKG